MNNSIEKESSELDTASKSSNSIARKNSLNDMIISPYGIVYLPSSPTSTSNITTINNNYNKDIKNNTNTPTTPNSTSKKKVTFVKDTLPGREVRCAITIIHCEKIFGGIMIYQIRCWAGGRSWILERRYRHFEALHKDILKEMRAKYGDYYNVDDLPSLPTKRWFERQRWLNKYDADYIENRKQQLQDYLRQLLRNPNISVRSKIVSSFLEYELHTLGVVDDQQKEGVILDDETTTRVSDIHFRPDELMEQLNVADIINQNIETFDKSDNEYSDSTRSSNDADSTRSSYEDSIFTILTQRVKTDDKI